MRFSFRSLISFGSLFWFEFRALLKEKGFIITVLILILFISFTLGSVVYEATDFQPVSKAKFYLTSIVAAERGYALLKILLPFLLIFVLEIFVREKKFGAEDIVFSKPINPLSMVFGKSLSAFAYLISVIVIMFAVTIGYVIFKKEGAVEIIYFLKLWWLLLPTVIYFLGVLVFLHSIFWERGGAYGVYFAYLFSFIASTIWKFPFKEIHWWMDPFPLQKGIFYSELWGFGRFANAVFTNRLLFTLIGLFLLTTAGLIWQKRIIGRWNHPILIPIMIFFFSSVFYGGNLMKWEKKGKSFTESKEFKDELLSLSEEVHPIVKKGSINLSVNLEQGIIKGSSSFTLYNSSKKPIWRCIFIVDPKVSILDSSVSITDVEYTRLKEKGFFELKFLKSLPSYQEVEVKFAWEKKFSKAIPTILRKDGGGLNLETLLYPYTNSLIYGYDRISLPKIDLKVEVPKEFCVIFQGEFLGKVVITTGRVKKNLAEYSYRFTPGLSMPIVIGKYEVIEDSNASVYYVPKHKEAAELMLATVNSAVTLFSKFYDSLYCENLRVIELPEMGWGGFAVPSLFAINERFFFASKDSFNIFAAVHETSHQWWPMPFFENLEIDAPGYDFLIEAMANFSTLCWARGALPKESVIRVIDDVYIGKYRSARQADVEKPLGYIYEAEQERNMSLKNIIYSKGAYVLYMLKKIVGDSVFFECARNFLETYKSQPEGTFYKFLDLIQEKSEQDVRWFIEQWIYKKGIPDYKINKCETKGDTVIVEVENAGSLKMPVIVRVSNKEHSEEKETWLGEAEKKEIKFHIEFKPKKVEINPDREVFEADVINNSRDLSEIRREK